MSIEQRLDLERDDRRHESTQTRYAGRRKFACCWYCGSADGMQSIRREILADAGERIIALWDVKWHRKPGNSEQLFYACRDCNKGRNIPDGFEPMNMADVVAWLDADPAITDLSQYDWGEDPREMEPDHEALAAEEPVSQIGDSRDSAGL